VLISNLSLVVFVKHQVNWLNRFHSLPSEGKNNKKQLKGKSLRSPSLTRAKASRCSHSLSFHKKHICLTKYIGVQKSTSSGVPIHASKGVLLLAMQALLVTLIELFFKLQAFSWWRRTRPTWVTGQTGKSK
jgi:hypothetical protein